MRTTDTFVRIRHPHPLAGMTGTVVSTDGDTVRVYLTAWGTEQTFQRADLIGEIDMTPEWRAERRAKFRARLRAAVATRKAAA